MDNVLKIGGVNFWNNAEDDFINYLIEPLAKNGFKIYLINPFENEGDIVFSSGFGDVKKEDLKGDPIIINYSGEHPYREDLKYIPSNYYCGFLRDAKNTLYYPLWQINYDKCIENPLERREEDILHKDKFCTFITTNPNMKSEGVKRRTNIFHKLSEYKMVDSYGRYLNNTHIILPSYKTNFRDIQNLHKRYKFNICFENTASDQIMNYITEKLIFSYQYGVIPIYWGGNDDDIKEIFNEKAFINCNKLSDKEIKEIVIELDNNDKLYRDMYMEKLFKADTNWREYAENRFYNFVKNILYNG